MKNYTLLVEVVMVGIYLMSRYRVCSNASESLTLCSESHNCCLQVFDFRSLTWSSLKLKANAGKYDDNSSQENLPATSGHNMVKICMHKNFSVHIC